MMQGFSVHWWPLLPVWGIALTAAVLLALLAQGSRLLLSKKVPRHWVAVLAALRVLSVALFVLCLLQPVVSFRKGVTRRPELLVLIDTSQSMGATDSPSGRTRLEDARSALRQNNLLQTLSQRFRLHWFAFDRQSYPIPLSGLEVLQTNGASTHYARSLTSAFDLLDTGAVGQPPASSVERVLLVSDGHDHGAKDLAEAATGLGVAVDTLAAGEAGTPGSAAFASINRVQAAPRVLLGSDTQFLVTLQRGTAASGECELVLYEDGAEVHRQNVALGAPGGEQQVKVSYRPAESGLKRFELALSPKTTPAISESAERYGVNVQVVDDKIEVLLIEDRWRWEFKFLRRVLEDDPSFNLTALLSRGAGAYVHFGEPERRVNLGSFPQSRTELDWFDIIVLGDVHPARWPEGLSGAVADAVIEGGKSLIVVAGPSLDELARIPELHTLLPVELTLQSAAPLEGPIDLRVTAEGAQSSLLASGPGAVRELPALDRIYPPLRKRPAATVLVEAAGQANAAGPLIALAEQPVGRGRVLYVGADSLWKWQTLTAADEQGQTLYSKFWQQALRAFTPGRPASGAGLWLQADRSRYETGHQIALRADVSPRKAGDGLTLQGTVILPDERRLPLPFTPDRSVSGAHVAEFDATMPGRYRISLAAFAGGQPVAETSTAVEVTGARTELETAGVDHAALARIAAQTGGKQIDPADAQTWPAPSARQLRTADEQQTVNLWENLSLLVLLSLVQGSDWLLRLMRGFV